MCGIADVRVSVSDVVSAALAASETDVFRLTFPTIESRPLYFQALFLKGNGDAVHAANAACRRAFGQDKETTAYTPHLSLYYGHIGRDEAPAIVEKLSQELPAEPLAFDVEELTLWKLEGGVEAWKQVAAYPLRRTE